MQNVTYDLTGSGISSTSNIWGTSPATTAGTFFTKYDYSTYTQFYQAETMYGAELRRVGSGSHPRTR